MKNLFLFLVFPCLLSSCDKPDEHIQTLDEVNEGYKATSRDLSKRQKIIDEWYQALDSFALLCQADTEIMRVYSMLKLNYATCTLDKSGEDRLIYKSGKMPHLLIMPLYYDDEIDTGFFFSKQIEDSYGYTTSVNTKEGKVYMIFLKRRKNLTSFSKAMVLLHEGKHLLDDMNGAMEDEFDREITVRMFDRRVLEKIGGKAFSILVNEMIRENYSPKSQKKKEVSFQDWDKKYWSKIEKIFNLSNVSMEEKRRWMMIISIDAKIRLFEKEEANFKKQKEFIRKTYETYQAYEETLNP